MRHATHAKDASSHWPMHFNYAMREGIQNSRGPSMGKAKEMLRHGEVGGQPLSQKQKGLFGLIAGGGKPSKKKGHRG